MVGAVIVYGERMRVWVRIYLASKRGDGGNEEWSEFQQKHLRKKAFLSLNFEIINDTGSCLSDTNGQK